MNVDYPYSSPYGTDNLLRRKPLAAKSTGSIKGSGIPQYRKKRLPWLDGSESRKGSMPTVPGAFTDEHLEAAGTISVPKNTSFAGVKLSAPERLAPRPPSAHSEIASTSPTITPSALPGGESSRPAVPLLALARELYKTDSSAAVSDSETERSIRGGRRRALGEPTRVERLDHEHALPSDGSPLALQASNFKDVEGRRKSRFAEDELLSPRAPATRRQTQVDRSSSLSSPAAPSTSIDRQPSISLQPLRSKKVTIRPDDIHPASRLNKRQSLSVQPLKTPGLSRSFQEDLSSDYVKSPKLRASASQSASEQKLRKSIAGLDTLMQEAVQLAKDAANSGRAEEVPGIMDEARLALNRANTVQQDSDRASKRQPEPHLSSSEPSSGSSSASDDAEEASTFARRVQVVPASRKSFYAGTKDGPTSDQGSVNRASSPSGAQAVWDEDYPNHRIDPQTKPEEPKTADFAYPQDARTPTLGPGFDKGKAREGLQNQQRPPAPTRNPTNPPPIGPPVLPTSEQVQEHIRQFNEPPIPTRRSSLANQRSQSRFEGTTSPEPQAVEAENEAPRGAPEPTSILTQRSTGNWGRDKYDEAQFGKGIDLRGKNHWTLKEGERFSLHHGHKRQPIARNWGIHRKRFVATVTCCNTALIGVLIGIYAGEVPAIQYTLADLNHQLILGNVYLYIGMAITTFFFWPLPLLHGRKPYTLVALGLALPLQIPQAIIVQERRSAVQSYSGYMTGLLLARGLLGLALGFAHINFKSTLLDLFGASLQSEFPHGEVVITDDIRRHGGGMGYWLGIWSFCWIGSLSLGFLIGTEVVSGLNQAWGFYICVILVALALLINVLTPETRRSPHRRTVQEVELPNDSVSRRVARGEIKMHVTGDGPKWWWEEVFAGVYLSIRMLLQSGFLLMALYVGWIYAQVVLIIVLLGNLLSTEYRWRPEYVGLGVLAVGVGALLAVPNSKANFFSRSRVNPARTDSMTFQPRFAWTSHLVRRALFMSMLPLAGLAYTLASKGRRVQFMVPIVFAGLIGYISNLAIAECNGIIMENYDTSDLQPGTNSRHRLQSLQASIKRRRTTYTSYPRVSAGLFTAQTLGFLVAAAATGVGGKVTRHVGAQIATAITAGILFGLTLLLVAALYRFKVVQVIPNELFGSYFGSGEETGRRKSNASLESTQSWRAVIIGNPSGKNRKMSWLELGSLSRWTEIRRLNRLLTRSTTQGLNPGWQ